MLTTTGCSFYLLFFTVAIKHVLGSANTCCMLPKVFQSWCIKYTQLTLHFVYLLINLPADTVLLYLWEMWIIRGCLSLSSCQTKGCKMFQKTPLPWNQLFPHDSVQGAMCTVFFPDLRFTVPCYSMLETLSSLELNKMVSLWNRPCARWPGYKSVCFHNTPAGLAPGCYLEIFLVVFEINAWSGVWRFERE